MTLPFIVFGDVEQELRTALLDGLATFGETAGVYTRIPTTRPAEFFRIFRAGGPRENLIVDAARVTVEAWAGTEVRAAEMLNRARAVIFAQNGTLFGADEYGGPANLPDPTTDQVRYTASFTVRARAALTA